MSRRSSRPDDPRASRGPARALDILRALRGDRGEELVELTLTLPILLVLVFGILEFGMLFDQNHTMTGLAREGANLASRGTSLDSVVLITDSNAGVAGLRSGWGTIATQLEIQGGEPVVLDQRTTAGFGTMSRMGAVGDTAQPLRNAGLLNGEQYHTVEMFVGYQSFTPLKRLVTSIVPDTLYDFAIF